MKIWNKQATLEKINALSKGTMAEHLGLTFTNMGDDYITGTLPVDHRTKQPYGLIHGGATAMLAETLGSVASHLASHENQIAVGTQLNISHLHSAKSGIVTGTCRPIKLGKTLHVWQIDIHTDQTQTSSAQLTTFVKTIKS